VELAKRIWGDRYEVLVTTHLNTHCVHNHLVINSVSYVDGKKLNNNYAMYFKNLRAESDRLCREHRLSVVTEPGQSSGSRYLREAEKRGEPTIRNVIRSDMPQVNSQYAALVLIDILYENELINKATYDKIQNKYKRGKRRERRKQHDKHSVPTTVWNQP